MRRLITLLLSAAAVNAAHYPALGQESSFSRFALPSPPIIGNELPPAPLPRFDPKQNQKDNKDVRNAIASEIISLKEKLGEFDRESICGLVDDSQHVEFYNGRLGPSRLFVDKQEPSTAQIQWNDLASTMNAPGDDPGNVGNERWCSGTLISSNMFLTAGHCFDTMTTARGQRGWRTPSRTVDGNEKFLQPKELAPLMHVNFNYQLNGQSRELREPKVFKVAALLEYREGKLDFAIIELSRNEDGKFPGDLYQVASLSSKQETLNASTTLTIIQHPNGSPKVVEAGPKKAVSGPYIEYEDLDTLGGSSGAGIIDQNGNLIGVHTEGYCTRAGGTNKGVTLQAISKHSNLLK